MKPASLLRLSVLTLALALSACAAPRQTTASTASGSDPISGAGYVGAGIEPEAPKVVVKEVNPYQPVTIRVTGVGAAPLGNTLSPSQRKLLGLRAAKLDAFRAVAEEVQGMKLVGNSSVSNMLATNDAFRTYVDAYLRGVKVLSNTMAPDGTTEAVAEIVLDNDFYREYKKALDRSGSVMKAAQQSAVDGVACTDGNCGASRYDSNFYVAQ
ncbi:LPP20 family lipoprotein [Pseudogulbenkiania subflava]|uniref:Lipoprotein LPP20-like domain-containing protein n=1 Tax=Pseudogulbenkiania subflava DSM 22618 TaxID=1123014 RepID=A0A1Y6BWK8_9NEIS|nr:LPP20 family lipoprotein [Pseudogulbenkiania subflava]SMF24748.1 hypothetical protein SAMN02745746_02122 [Pseudogulbenkiania subflava DSM 22618]